MKWTLQQTSYTAHIYRAIIAFIVGAVVLFMPYDTLNSIVVMVGCFVLLAGVGSAYVAYRSTSSFFSGLNGTSSLVSIVFGLLCIIRPWFFVDIMIFIIGLILSLVGVVQMLSVRRISHDFKRSVFYYPGSIATLLVGLFIVFFPQYAINIIGVVLGIVLIIYALNEAGISLRMYRMFKNDRTVEDVSFEEID